MRMRVAVLVAGAVALAATALDAHDTWLLPSSYRGVKGTRMDVHLTSGMTFAADDFLVEAARIVKADVRLAGTTKPLADRSASVTALKFAWTPAASGLATFGVSLRPKDLELKPELIEEYFADINADAATRAAWAKMPAPKTWREKYVKHATTYVCVAGGSKRDSSWVKPMGLGLEIVPESDPSDAHAGQPFKVRVLHNGAPVAGFQLGAERDGTRKASFRATDKDGRAAITFGTPGWWLLHGTSLRRATDASHEWDSDFATMSFVVLQAAAKGGC